jgi:exodeoxyribonuclease-3
MKVSCWNVNSIRARRDAVFAWLESHEPDVLCLQETKVVDDEFPSEEFQRHGYEVSFAGQPGYNGVAIASRLAQSDVRVGLAGAEPDDDKRLLSALVAGVRIVTAYVPNGKNVESEAFDYKLRWLERLATTIQALPEEALLLCGDFNIARDERDVFDVERMQGQLHFHPREHEALERLLAVGLQDSLRLFHQQGQLYSWWDYRAGAFRRDRGLRIDYIFLSAALAQRCTSAGIDKATRALPKPSDHAPLFVEFDA